MAIELKFSKSDSERPWGFRLTGGADFDIPLIVSKVTENSLAENSGLQANDVIVRIDDVATAGLSHLEAHDVLQKVGNNFVLAVRRDHEYDLSSIPTIVNQENHGNEIQKEFINAEQILTSSHQATYQEESQVSVSQTFEQQAIICDENTSSINALCELIRIDEEEERAAKELEAQKWSTFLQRPKNAKPQLKQKEDDKTVQGESYKVVIKKQKKKCPYKKYLTTEEKFIEPVIQSANAPEENLSTVNYEPIKPENANTAEEDEEITEQQEPAELVDVEITATITDELLIEEIADGGSDYDEPSGDENKSKSELTHSVEEQLINVQQQLLALSKLPSAIQQSLDAITAQLSKIVVTNVKVAAAADEDKETSEAGTVTESDITDAENDEEHVVHLDYASDMSVIEEDLEMEEKEVQDVNSDIDTEDIDNKQREEIKLQEELEKEEELAAFKLEQLKKAKEQKEAEERKAKSSMPLKPIDRPIILPGGRRWSQPDDACVAVRHPKMTDEKIANMIETYSEKIIGKTKGINFLKYQPPPKNLNYLQNSEVFKLIHDEEEPVRGICSRASKILAEEDYYKETRSASPQ